MIDVRPGFGKLSLRSLNAWLLGTYVADREWESRTAILSLYTPLDPTAGPRLLVKQPAEWSAERAEAAFATLDTCRSSAQDCGEPHFVPQPYWWGASPPFLCMEWVDGAPLMALIRDRLVQHEPLPHEWLATIAFEVGAKVARYHEAFAPVVSSLTSEGLVAESRRSRGRFARLAQFIAGPAAVAVGTPVRTLGDSGPNNIVMDRDGRAWLIDLPVRAHVRPAQWDIARMAHRLLRSAEQALGDAWRPHRQLDDNVVDAIMAGYSAHGPPIANTGASIALVYAYLATEALISVLTDLKSKPRRPAGASRETLRAVESAVRARRPGRRRPSP